MITQIPRLPSSETMGHSLTPRPYLHHQLCGKVKEPSSQGLKRDCEGIMSGLKRDPEGISQNPH